jgi:hypothetical protein
MKGFIGGTSRPGATTPSTNPRVPSPTFSPGSGHYTYPVNIDVACAIPQATIFLTWDGTTPSNSHYHWNVTGSGRLPVYRAITLKAIAYHWGYNESSVSSAIYT